MENLVASLKLRSNPTARRLLDYLEANQGNLRIEDAYVYFEFPLYQDYEDDVYKPSFLILSKRLGVVLIKTLVSADTRDIGAADDQLSQIHSLVLGKLIKSRALRTSARQLKFDVLPILYVDSARAEAALTLDYENKVVTSLDALKDVLMVQPDAQLDGDIVAEARSILEGAKALSKGNIRAVPEGDTSSKRAILAELEAEIINLDEVQRKAAIALVDGPQRIRGLAGSGKTVVLAMKAAHLHLNNPESKILFTFNTKSLYETIRNLVTRFYRQSADRDPDWDKLHIMHGWGGAQLGGVYYNAAKSARIPFLAVRDVPRQEEDKLDYACRNLISAAKIEALYDHVLIDEAQDFGNAFFRLCLALTKGKGDQRSIIWAYDELQSIFSVKTRTPLELFGLRKDGEAEIDLERAARSLELPGYMSNDLILHKCYRNAREVLVCAHALGFAIYASTPVQMLQDRNHWEDVGYEVLSGNFTAGSPTDVVRPQQNSPLSISQRQGPRDLIQFWSAKTFDEEVDWVADGVKSFLDDGLNPEDILIVSLDDRNAKSYFGWLGIGLRERGIAANNLKLASSDNTQFRVAGEATLSTVYQAKGNEAPVVFVIGLDAVYSQRDLRLGRNKIFTAMTRSKAWVRLSGLQHSNFFFSELEKALLDCPHLRFNYPDPEKVETLQRDLSIRSARLRQLMLQLDQEGATTDEIVAMFESEKKVVPPKTES